jgi:hypothetical protein
MDSPDLMDAWFFRVPGRPTFAQRDMRSFESLVYGSAKFAALPWTQALGYFVNAEQAIEVRPDVDGFGNRRIKLLNGARRRRFDVVGREQTAGRNER